MRDDLVEQTKKMLAKVAAEKPKQLSFNFKEVKEYKVSELSACLDKISSEDLDPNGDSKGTPMGVFDAVALDAFGVPLEESITSVVARGLSAIYFTAEDELRNIRIGDANAAPAAALIELCGTFNKVINTLLSVYTGGALLATSVVSENAAELEKLYVDMHTIAKGLAASVGKVVGNLDVSKVSETANPFIAISSPLPSGATLFTVAVLQLLAEGKLTYAQCVTNSSEMHELVLKRASDNAGMPVTVEEAESIVSEAKNVLKFKRPAAPTVH